MTWQLRWRLQSTRMQGNQYKYSQYHHKVQTLGWLVQSNTWLRFQGSCTLTLTYGILSAKHHLEYIACWTNASSTTKLCITGALCAKARYCLHILSQCYTSGWILLNFFWCPGKFTSSRWEFEMDLIGFICFCSHCCRSEKFCWRFCCLNTTSYGAIRRPIWRHSREGRETKIENHNKIIKCQRITLWICHT